MQIIEVDDVQSQALEAGLDRVSGPDRHGVGAAGAMDELRRDHQPLAAVGDGAAEQGLVVTLAVGGGGVEEGDAELDGAVQGLDRLGVVGLAIAGRQPHRAETLAADGEGTEFRHLAALLAGRWIAWARIPGVVGAARKP